MGLPNETSIQCIKCNVFNLENAVILNGDVYCLSCFKKSSDLKIRLSEMLFEED